MNRKMKEQLKKIYTAPKPLRKEIFLKSIERELEEDGISYRRLMRYQIGYIRKWNWAAAAGVFLLTIVGTLKANAVFLYITGACIPFLALSTVTEGSRSARYKMEELEMASRFSIKTVLAARLGILGGSNLILLGILLLIFGKSEIAGTLYTGLYILIPYFLTVFSDLFIMRKIHGNEGIYACFGVTSIVSFGCSMYPLIWELLQERPWMSYLNAGTGTVLLLLLAMLTGREIKSVFTQWEEYGWSLT